MIFAIFFAFLIPKIRQSSAFLAFIYWIALPAPQANPILTAFSPFGVLF